ncbi:Tetraspanin family-domain-containing protein [Zychaea mexicana]|uniref:Tetraspanin family-domain-containing protein n=1 Tax=Zychaea mexicana TaxID=64656 RepID=UPI0022FE9A96|nr:Tetraspanin family-domain-containing protein [Zychaea mexicana]KAI9492731.1 Tetraspanin family-domain-containing protein [Zychaea mexicana]
MEERFVSRRTRGLREAVAVFHLIFMVAGLAILSLGAYTINSSLSRTLSIALLTIGGALTIVSFIAYFGAHIEHAGFLKTYSSTVALLLILEIVLVALVYAHRKELDDYGSWAWDFFQQNDGPLLSQIEDSLYCCGYDSPHDRLVPSSTCKEPLPDTSGCKSAFTASFIEWRDWILAAVLIIVGLELTALLTSVVLTVMVERDSEEEQAYMTLLSAQSNTHGWFDVSNSGGSLASGSGGGGGGHGNVGSGNGSSSPVFGRHPLSSYSSAGSRSGFFYTPRPPSYHQQPHRVPRYGSTLSTSSHK